MVDLDHDATPLSAPQGTLEPMNGPREPCVAILLSIYNGERYLQLSVADFRAPES